MQGRFKELAELWFLTEPAYFALFCTHELRANPKMACPIRTGQGRLEYNPELLTGITHKAAFHELFGIEMLRLFLKHPYERTPDKTPRTAIFEENKLTNAIREEGKDRYLLVKLRYRRRIEIKLRLDMNMALLSSLAEMITTIRNAMDKVGSVTINVRGYGNNIDWKQSEAPAAGVNEETEDEP